MKDTLKSNPAIRDNYKNASLLIIEDDPKQAALMKDAVFHWLPEVKASYVSSEAEALAYLDQCRMEEWTYPKLILLDLYLPDRQNGWRLLERLKAMPAEMGKIPIILVSQSTDQRDIREAYQRGCSAYLTKPCLLSEWSAYFQSLRTYWWETVTLPKVSVSLF